MVVIDLALSCFLPANYENNNLYYRVVIDLVKLSIVGAWLMSMLTLAFRRTRLFNHAIVFYTSYSFIILTVIYAFFFMARVDELYKAIKSPLRGWSEGVHQKDEVLGFKPMPNSTGFQLFSVGDNIPVRYDSNSFRVPIDYKNASTEKPLILFLGCSYTYGDACYAKESFPYLVSRELEMNYINAGVCSYGLTQMLIVANELIPKYKPNYVVVQYSPWLSDRAANPYALTYHARLPVPYITIEEDALVINPPGFLTRIYEVPLDKYKRSEANSLDRLGFYFEVGIPLLLLDDVNVAFFKASRVIGLAGQPNEGNKEKLEKLVYSRFHELCRIVNAKLIVLNIGAGDMDYTKESKHLFDDDIGVYIAQGDSVLWAALTEKNESEYSLKYEHWRNNGQGNVLVDDHPNAAAHELIAKSILLSIGQGEDSTAVDSTGSTGALTR